MAMLSRAGQLRGTSSGPRSERHHVKSFTSIARLRGVQSTFTSQIKLKNEQSKHKLLTVKELVQAAVWKVVIDQQSGRRRVAVSSKVDKISVLEASQDL